MSDQAESAPLAPPAAPSPPLLRRRWVSLAALVVGVVLFGGAWYGYSQQAAPPQEGGPRGAGVRGRPAPIVVEAARSEDFPLRLAAIGSVVPRNIVTVRSRVDGALDHVLFEEGQLVRAGDLLAEIDPRPFEVTLTQAQGQLGKDQALLANARADLRRYEGLAKLDAIPVQQLDTQRALVGQFEASIKADQGAVDGARLQLSYTRISAPFAGRVGLRQVDPGNMVRSADANGIVVLTQVQPVTVVFPIPEAELGRLLARLGMQAPPAPRSASRGGGGAAQQGRRSAAVPDIDVEAWDRDGKLLLASGKLLTVDNQLDATTGTVKVKAIFPNTDAALFPNQFVNVRLVVSELKEATVIPSAAVQRGARGSFVWLVQAEEKTVSMRQVGLGAVDGESVPVLEGLKPGELVAVDGFDRLREGATVELVTRDSRAVKAGPGKPREGRRGQGGQGGQGGPRGGEGGMRGGGPRSQS